jgi:uncharacterized membrane protein
MLLFVAIVSFLAIAISLRFVLLGAWMVMPFALLEIIVLGGGFYAYERATAYREVIALRDDQLLVTREARSGNDEWSFQPYWVQVLLQMDPRSWYPSRLLIRSHGRQIEVGSCLTEEEREQLFCDLKGSLTEFRRTTAPS